MRWACLSAVLLAGYLLLAQPAGAAPGFALAATQQGKGGVGDLWEQYPLDDSRESTKTDADGRSTPARSAAEPKARRPDARVATLVITLGLTAVCILLLARRARRRARMDRTGREQAAASGAASVDGYTDRDGIGAFSGHVHARVERGASHSEPMLLVRDPSRESSIWVRESELAPKHADQRDEAREHRSDAGVR